MCLWNFRLYLWRKPKFSSWIFHNYWRQTYRSSSFENSKNIDIFYQKIILTLPLKSQLLEVNMKEHRLDIAYAMVRNGSHGGDVDDRIVLCPQDILNDYFSGSFRELRRFVFADLYQRRFFSSPFFVRPIKRYKVESGTVDCLELKRTIPTGPLLDAAVYAVGLHDELPDFEKYPIILGIHKKGSSIVIFLERDHIEEVLREEIVELLRKKRISSWCRFSFSSSGGSPLELFFFKKITTKKAPEKPGLCGKSGFHGLNSSLMPTLARVFSSAYLMITAQ